jgi:hypothetical protein
MRTHHLLSCHGEQAAMVALYTYQSIPWTVKLCSNRLGISQDMGLERDLHIMHRDYHLDILIHLLSLIRRDEVGYSTDGTTTKKNDD